MLLAAKLTESTLPSISSYLTAPSSESNSTQQPIPSTLFLLIADRTYPRLLAFSFLLELSKSFFGETPADEIRGAVRPYACIRFETQIQSAKRRYLNTRSLRTADNLAELSASLQSVETWRAEDAFGGEYAPPRSGPTLPKLNLNLNGLGGGMSSLLEGSRGVGKGPPMLFRIGLWKWVMTLLGCVVGGADWWFGSQCLDFALSDNPILELGVGFRGFVFDLRCDLLSSSPQNESPHSHLPSLLLPTSLLLLLLWTTPPFHALNLFRPLPWFIAPHRYVLGVYALASLLQVYVLKGSDDVPWAYPEHLPMLKFLWSVVMLLTLVSGRRLGGWHGGVTSPLLPKSDKGMPTPTRQTNGVGKGWKFWGSRGHKD
jgi:hypothetical protein